MAPVAFLHEFPRSALSDITRRDGVAGGSCHGLLDWKSIRERAVIAEASLMSQNNAEKPVDPADSWWPLVSECLHQLARHALAGERRDHTLQPTALVHEAWLRLAGSTSRFNDPTHFQAVAARALREVLVDHARRRSASKRGGGWTRVALEPVALSEDDSGVDVLALEEALQRLGTGHARAAQVVELRFFGGMTVPEVADVLGVSSRTVDGDWQFARAWLMRELWSETADSEPPS